jgi:TonB C terminal/MORN repeat variant
MAIGCALVLWQCAASSKPQQGFYASGKLRYAIDRDKEGRKVGLERWWHENGQLKYEATFADGFRQGRYAAFYPDGKPWYQGFEIMGRPESTLTYWHPNGHMRSKAFFRQGIQLSREDFDEQGISLSVKPNESTHDATEMARRADSLRTAKVRERALAAWGKRVRSTVESHWVVPKQLAAKGPLKAVASVTVSRHGDIDEVRWVSKSPVSAFNTLAANTFKKVKRLPPFPPQVKDKSLEIEYAFVSGGQASAKARLKAGQTYGDSSAEVEVPDPTGPESAGSDPTESDPTGSAE